MAWVGRNRVLRLMRDNQLLSPFRRPPRPANDHDGTILTEAPDVLWGTDATLVQTAEEARVWVFAAIDHFNSEVVGHHVSTDGSRFSALEPVRRREKVVHPHSRCSGIGLEHQHFKQLREYGDVADRIWHDRTWVA
jgi:transposase InsO family protein